MKKTQKKQKKHVPILYETKISCSLVQCKSTKKQCKKKYFLRKNKN